MATPQQAANVPPPGSAARRQEITQLRDILKSNPRAANDTRGGSIHPIDVQQLKVLIQSRDYLKETRPIAAPTSDATASTPTLNGVSATDVAKVKAGAEAQVNAAGTSDASTTAETVASQAAAEGLATAAGNVGPAAPTPTTGGTDANRRDDALTQKGAMAAQDAMGAPAANDPSLSPADNLPADKTKDMVAGLSPNSPTNPAAAKELNRRMGAISANEVAADPSRGNANVFYSNGRIRSVDGVIRKRNPNMAASSAPGITSAILTVAYLYHFLGAGGGKKFLEAFIRDNIQKAQRDLGGKAPPPVGIPRVNQMDPWANAILGVQWLFQFVNGTWDGMMKGYSRKLAKAESGFNYTAKNPYASASEALITDAANMMGVPPAVALATEKYPIEMLGRKGALNVPNITTGSSSINLSDVKDGDYKSLAGNLGQVVDAVGGVRNYAAMMSSDGARASGYIPSGTSGGVRSLEVTGEDEEDSNISSGDSFKAIKNNGKRARWKDRNKNRTELETLKLLSKEADLAVRNMREVNINPLGGDANTNPSSIKEISLMMSTAYSLKGGIRQSV
ncbi:hypothetical protein SPFM12_00038 [Salmonella phage SPFM12]|nr:hypothetical protein SPFM12_00038 [Salmonella phage SPFM12]